MYCRECGKEIAADAVFCAYCGAQTGVAMGIASNLGVSRESTSGTDASAAAIAEHYYAYARAQSEYDQMVDQAQSRVAYAEENLASLRKTYKNCLIVGTVVVVFAALYLLQVLVPGLLFWSSTATDQTIANSVVFGAVVGPIMLVLVFFAPFGFVPIKNFVNSHGYIIWLTLFFIIVLCMFILMFVLFAGIPCFFMQRSKIKAAEQEVEFARQSLQTIAT